MLLHIEVSRSVIHHSLESFVTQIIFYLSAFKTRPNSAMISLSGLQLWKREELSRFPLLSNLDVSKNIMHTYILPVNI